MYGKAHSHSPNFGMSRNPANVALTILLTLLFLIFMFLFLSLTATPAQGQTYSVIYSFTGGADGGVPLDFGLTMDEAGNLYGTTTQGGRSGECDGGCGTVFKLMPKNSSWLLTPIYTFAG